MGSFWSKIEVFYRPEWTKRRTIWKWILNIFKFRNECYKQLERKKHMKKMGSCLVFMFPFRVMVFKLSKKVHFCNLVLTSVRNRSLLKQLHIYIWKVSLRTFRKRHCLLCYGLLFWRFGDIRVWSRRILLNFRWVSILFNTLIANISWRWLRPL